MPTALNSLPVRVEMPVLAEPEICLRLLQRGSDSRVPPAAYSILAVLARQYSAIGAEIGLIDKSILAWHR